MSDRIDLGAVRRLRQAVEDLPRELQPARELWPEIAGRLKQEPRHSAGSGWWRLAAAVLMIVGGLAAAALLRPEAPVARPGLAASAPSAVGAELAAPRLRQRDGVLHAHNDLVAVVSRRRGYVDEAGAAALSAGLADLERATAEIEAALSDNPGDRRLRLALAAAYRREANWTSRLNRV